MKSRNACAGPIYPFNRFSTNQRHAERVYLQSPDFSGAIQGLPKIGVNGQIIASHDKCRIRFQKRPRQFHLAASMMQTSQNRFCPDPTQFLMH
jgi:hypothetical protein